MNILMGVLFPFAIISSEASSPKVRSPVASGSETVGWAHHAWPGCGGPDHFCVFVCPGFIDIQSQAF